VFLQHVRKLKNSMLLYIMFTKTQNVFKGTYTVIEVHFPFTVIWNGSTERLKRNSLRYILPREQNAKTA